MRLGLRDARVALGLGDRPGLVGLGVGRLAHLHLQLLLGPLGLELRDLRLLDDDLLPRGRGRERPGLLGLRLSLLRLGRRLRLLDLRLARRGDLERLRLLLALGRLAVGRRLRDPRLLRDPRRLRHRQVLDVAGGVLDLLDLERVDRQPEPLHLDRRRLARRLGQRVAVPDHVLDRHRPDDRAQVAGEDVVHLHVHLLLLVEEAPRRVRDRLVVVGDLVDHDRLDADADPLRRDALEVELGLVDVEREPPDLLQARQVERALADDDLEARAPPRHPRRRDGRACPR